MRHAFSFPPHIREAVRNYISNAITGMNPTGFQQEPAYIAALLGRLEGTAYEGPDGYVRISATNVDSVGPGAAESRAGADLAITADIQRDGVRVRKAIIAQAKRGSLAELPASERERLTDQIQNMRRLTLAPKVILVEEIEGRREPRVASGLRIVEGVQPQVLSLPDYFVRRILPTLDGDTREGFVNAVQESSLRQLRVLARVRSEPT